MAKGTVKWFNSAKGYGFICSENCEQDVFAHFSSIVMEGYKTLKAGQTVNFEVSEGPKGLHAADIRPDGGENTDYSEGNTVPCEAEMAPA